MVINQYPDFLQKEAEKKTHIYIHIHTHNFPRWCSGEESTCQCKRCRRCKTWVRSLGQEVPLEEEMATHSIILAWKIPWTEEPGGLQSMGPQRVRHD